MDYYHYGEREKVQVIMALERALIDELVNSAGMTNSDAQGVVEAIIMRAT